MSEQDTIECAIAMVHTPSRSQPLCEMFKVDRRSMRWTSKHFSNGQCFADGGRLWAGETARLLAEQGTGSGISRCLGGEPVTFVVATLPAEAFEETSPDDWTLERLRSLPEVSVRLIDGSTAGE